MLRKKLLLTATLFFSLCLGKAQLPVCSANHIIYTITQDGIYNVDLSQPVPTEVLNTIKVPAGALGLAIGPNLNAATPAFTFYTIGNNGTYLYYDGNSWINTNHNAGSGVNIGAGGGYIYNYDANGIVTRYNGTGDAIPIVTLPGLGSVADLAVDCCGNFYNFHNGLPQTLTKFSPAGVVLKTYAITGAPVFSGGGGIVVFGNDVYYDDLSASTTPPLLHGTIVGDTVHFVPAGFNITFAYDMASCPGNLASPAPVNVSICSNQLPYNWNGQNYNAPGSYTVTLTNTCGCDSVVTLNLALKPVITTRVDTAICNSQLPFNWNGQNYNTQGTYTTTLTASDGCDSTITLNLTIRQLPPLPFVTSPVNYCQFQTTQPLSATATGNLMWYTVALGGIGTPTAPIPSATNTGLFNFYVTQSVAGCESPRAMITVNVLEPPALGADKSITICNGESANLAGLFNTAGSVTNWFLNQVPITNTTSVSIAGRYQLIATNQSGCTDTAFVNLVVQPAIIAFAGNDDSTEINVPYQLSGSGGMEYEWSPGSPLLNNASIPNPVAILTANTTFSLIVKDAVGCKGYDTVTIKIFKGSGIHVPSAFTPNGDGLNDILHPLGTSLSRLDYFRVYNRYGELIFETNDPSKGWNGTYKGKDQNTGTYIWMLKALDSKKVIRIMRGSVMLLR